MTISEYQKLAQRTCNDLGSLQENVTHMKLGIYTEVGELLDVIKKHLAYGRPMDIVNVGEEIADATWYVVNEATFNKVTIHHIPEPFAVLTDIFDVIEWCERLMCCYIKSNDPNDEFIEVYGPYNRLCILSFIAKYFGLDIYKLLENNIDKLKVRYPEKFDAHFAVNRNLDRERIELEK